MIGEKKMFDLMTMVAGRGAELSEYMCSSRALLKFFCPSPPLGVLAADPEKVLALARAT